MNLWKTAPAVSLIALATVQANYAYAQSTAVEEASGRGLADIVVTAQKRAESLSKTAAAISVIGQATLDNTGSRTFGESVNTLPSVSANGLGGTIAIRGLGTNTLGAGNGTVAFHIDGIFQSTSEQSSATLYDVERVEVLRGPQGTLYGRNATAGVVNVITSNANVDKFEAFGDVSYGNWNTWAIRGAVNVPISDKFAVRLTGTYNKSDDWRKLENGDRPPRTDTLNLRLAWRAMPAEGITWDGRLSYINNKSLRPLAVPTYRYDTTTGQFIRSTNPVDIATLPVGAESDGLAFLLPPFGIPLDSVYEGLTYEEANRRDSRLVDFRSKLNFELSDTLSLTYLLGYAFQESPPGVISGLQPFQVSYAGTGKNNDWSHELNLHYDSERLNAIFGAYSFQQETFQPNQLVRIFRPNTAPNGNIIYNDPSVDSGTVNSGPEKNTTRAVFGQATFSVTDQFRVTGGVRYNWDKSTFADASTSLCPFGSGSSAVNPNEALAPAFFGFPPGTPLCTAFTFVSPGNFFLNQLQPGGSKSFEKFSWKAALEYDVSPDTMVYATVATGYKAGGVGDASAIGDARFFRPETNINYEAGIRSKLFENTLSLNLTAFWTDYKDLQIETTGSRPNQIISINAGKSRSRGLELEYAWAPTRADRISGYVTYLDAKFRDFPGRDDLTGITQNFRGNRLPGAPEFTARASYSHIFDLGSAGRITPTASIVYQTESFVSFTNTIPTRIPDYTRSDFLIRYETEDNRFSLEGFVNNIENKARLSQIFPQFNVSNAFYNPPRSYGIRAGFRY